MGDWGKQPWDNDEAADWYEAFWKEKDWLCPLWCGNSLSTNRNLPRNSD